MVWGYLWGFAEPLGRDFLQAVAIMAEGRYAPFEESTWEFDPDADPPVVVPAAALGLFRAFVDALTVLDAVLVAGGDWRRQFGLAWDPLAAFARCLGPE